MYRDLYNFFYFSKEQENAALISNGNPSSEIQDEEEQEGSEPKEEDGFFSRNLKRFLKYQTASQQATGLGYRIHKKVRSLSQKKK